MYGICFGVLNIAVWTLFVARVDTGVAPYRYSRGGALVSHPKSTSNVRRVRSMDQESSLSGYKIRAGVPKNTPGPPSKPRLFDIRVKVSRGGPKPVLVLDVMPYPARIYQNAPPNTPVLTVTGYDNGTGGPLDELALTQPEESSYFKLHRSTPLSWVLVTRRYINQPFNYTFHFRVYGTVEGVIRDKDVIIDVVEENMFAPTFDQPQYDFLTYRKSFEKGIDLLGTVHAVDNDTQIYNSYFQYRILDRDVRPYFNITPNTGKIMIVGSFPESISQYTFTVTAIDSGSPQKQSSTRVRVNMTDVPPPELFCVSVEGLQARICWKDPTNGAYVERYQLQIAMNDKNVTSHPVVIRGKKNEVCTQVRATRPDRSYRFTVKVFNNTHWSPDSVQRLVNITRNGLYGDCHLFSDCSVLQPCVNGGTCRTLPDMSYQCDCRDGYNGRNCTETDMCVQSPCQNNGSCTFISHEQFNCTCPVHFYGDTCQYINRCVSNPCLNTGTCYSYSNGTSECACPKTFIGTHCEIYNSCHNSPCQHGGNCFSRANGTHECSCAEGYYGSMCENTNVCIIANPCHHGGICNFMDDDLFNCTCAGGFIGEKCETVDMCHYMQCRNNATCETFNGTEPRCVCSPGYWGRECQNIDACFADPCLHNGICHNYTDGTFKCTCVNGNYGDRCEHTDLCYSSPCSVGGTCTSTSDTDFLCQCTPERYGMTCEKIDGCKAKLCEQDSKCINKSGDGEVECICKEGTYGQYCEEVDPCRSSPCKHGSRCVNVTTEGYHCVCPPGWVGSTCEVADQCSSIQCQNKGVCKYGIKDGSFYCDCKENFAGNRCEKYNFCNPRSNMCLNNAFCQNVDHQLHQIVINRTVANVTNWYSCDCSNGYTGQKCNVTIDPCSFSRCDKVCAGNSVYRDKTGRYIWRETGLRQNVSMACPYGAHPHHPLPFASRPCNRSPSGHAYWGQPDTTACRELTAAEAEKRLLDLMAFTHDPSHLTAEVVINATDILENLLVFAFDDDEIAEEVTRVVSNLLTATESVLIESNHRNHSSERLIKLLEDFTKEVKTETNVSITTENINVMVVNFSLPHNANNDTAAFQYQPVLENSQNQSGLHGVKMALPKEVFDVAGNKNVRLEFVSYRTSAFFLPDDSPPEHIVLKQRVISATVHNTDISGLNFPIDYSVPNIEIGSNHTCVYWKTENRTWSSIGMETVSTGGHVTDCRAYHLTSFAVLLDPTPNMVLSEDHDKALTSISYIGCAISIFGLTFTIVTFSIFRSLNRERSGKILLNMCVSMLMLNVSFLLMAETSQSDGEGLCIAVGVLIHYFLLTTLTWMCTEAINMYQALIKVFTKYSSYFILKRCVVAWGLPAVVVAVTMGVNNLDNYRSKGQLCFISQSNTLAFYITLLGPACCILIINTIVFTLVARVIMKPKFKGHSPAGEKNEKVTPAQVRGAFTVMVLLGITWVFGPVAIKESKIVFYYLFTILNSLQGFLIFVFRCLFNTEVRSAWVLLIKTGKFKRRRGPIKSIVESSSKGYHDNRMNGSYVDSNNTDKSNIGNSNVISKNNLKNERYKNNGNVQKYKNGNMPNDDRRTSNESRGSNDRRHSGDRRSSYDRSHSGDRRSSNDRSHSGDRRSSNDRRYSGDRKISNPSIFTQF
ncbi:cadherin EGF LAG seven-pass G-type receptor 1-like isoform X1 [Mizuhopecten yessoensis]|uniref:cadherin EGF LAG seven-pass G-type receptor 1-like isoform X1 n=1 Tax=Mizuhopecten yessoensis TaxID=6573 RepID=UPI000B45EA96|nr:cadherin EGF LAG seven-pass G-type receptor 1-like isoform X1 [Mizuhopecten yessoensis]